MCKEQKETIKKLDRVILYLTEERFILGGQMPFPMPAWQNYNDAIEIVRIAQMEVAS
jgi:hypothetical protein